MTKDTTDYKQAYQDLLLADRTNLRERIVSLLGINWNASMADQLYNCIINEPNKPKWDNATAGTPPWEEPATPAKVAGKKRGPKKVKKRKYVKRSKFWKNRG